MELHQLPTDVVSSIGDFLPTLSLCSFRLTCKKIDDNMYEGFARRGYRRVTLSSQRNPYRGVLTRPRKENLDKLAYVLEQSPQLGTTIRELFVCLDSRWNAPGRVVEERDAWIQSLEGILMSTPKLEHLTMKEPSTCSFSQLLPPKTLAVIFRRADIKIKVLHLEGGAAQRR